MDKMAIKMYEFFDLFYRQNHLEVCSLKPHSYRLFTYQNTIKVFSSKDQALHNEDN